MAETLLEFILRQLEQFPQAALLGRELREKNKEEFDLLCKQRLLLRLPLNGRQLYPCPSKDCCQAPGRSVHRSKGKLWAICECPAAEPDFEIQPNDLAEFRFDYASFAEAMQSAGDLSGRVETLSERFTMVGEKVLDSERLAVVLAFLNDAPESPALLAGLRNMLPAGFDKILVVTPTYQPAARDLADLERLGISLATGLRGPEFTLPATDVSDRSSRKPQAASPASEPARVWADPSEHTVATIWTRKDGTFCMNTTTNGSQDGRVTFPTMEPGKLTFQSQLMMCLAFKWPGSASLAEVIEQVYPDEFARRYDEPNILMGTLRKLRTLVSDIRNKKLAKAGLNPDILPSLSIEASLEDGIRLQVAKLKRLDDKGLDEADDASL